MIAQNVSLKKVVGKSYNRFWHFKGRYRIVKGSRSSKKSKTMALWIIVNMMNYPGANTLVVRKTFRTLKDSCFKEIKWAITRLQVQEHWKITELPLEITYIPTGQTIYFRGLDDPLKITSITVDVGNLCWMWIEEAYEIMKEDDFNILDESIRGQVDDDLFKQITFTFNPWNEHHWIKKRFFDAAPDPDILALTTNYLCNEWLDEADKKVFETMKRNNPRRYRVAGLGDWGIVEGLVYENWKEEAFVFMIKAEYEKCENKPDNVIFSDTLHAGFGLDFGYTNDPSAAFIGFIDLDNRKIYVYDEMYEKGLSNKRIHETIDLMGYSKDRFTGDSSEPKSIDELKGLGLKIKGALKGKDSINLGVQWIQDFEIIVHPRCVNFLTEISNYTWDKDKFGNKLNKPIDDFNHLMDAMRYGLEDFIKGGSKWMY